MHLSTSLLSGLTPSISGKTGRDAGAGAEPGNAGGDFSSLLSLLRPATGGGAAAPLPDAANAPLKQGEPETAPITAPAVDTAALVAGSAMPPVAATGKILPVSLPAELPLAASPENAAPESTDSVDLPPLASKALPVPATAPRPAGVEVASPVAAPVTEGATEKPAPATTTPSTKPAIPETETPPPARLAKPTGTIAKIVEVALAAAGKPAKPETVITDDAGNADQPEAEVAVEETPEDASPVAASAAAAVAAAILPLPLPVGKIAANSDNAPSEPKLAATKAPVLPALPRLTQAQENAPRRGEPAATPTKGAEATPAAAPVTPVLTLRMAEREHAPAAKTNPAQADARPANGERPASVPAAATAPAPAAASASSAAAVPIAAATPAHRTAAATDGEIERPKTRVSAPGQNAASAIAAPVTPASSDATPAAPVVRAQSAEPMADLAQIVDRLAAAREAVAPARAALSIDHAEFGELTLRFDQRHDGRLTAELAGANAEAHRAVAQAMAADRSSNAGHDSGTSQQQQQSQQQQSASSNNTARNASGDRDPNAGGNTSGDQRQDTSRQRGNRPADQQRAPANNSKQQSGVFA